MNGSEGKLSGKNLILPALVLLLWFVAFREALFSAISVWAISDIFTHCFFVLPGAMYLIWLERWKILAQPPRPNYWVLAPFALILLLDIFGFVASLQVFLHIAAFASFSLVIWLCLGNQVAKVIWFPLLFTMFSVPIGEELVPYLQEITADMATAFLEYSGVPVFRNGLYLEIPEGRFIVAEACSGVSFFVASIVFGALYSYLSYHTFLRRFAYMVVAVIVPIIANGLRVFGIIIVGHFIDMKYASGVDHLTFGWIFFALVILSLFVIGELWREPASVRDAIEKTPEGSFHEAWQTTNWKVPFGVVALCFVLLIVWQESIDVGDTPGNSKIDTAQFGTWSVQASSDPSWQPQFKNSTDSFQGIYKGSGRSVDLFISWFEADTDKAELVSSVNRVFRPKRWSLLSSSKTMLTTSEGEFRVTLLDITVSQGRNRLIVYWYEVFGANTERGLVAKFLQTINVLAGRSGAGAFIAYSLPYGDDSDAARGELMRLVGSEYSAMKNALPFDTAQ